MADESHLWFIKEGFGGIKSQQASPHSNPLIQFASALF
jgi:hypothetical protein